MSKIVNVVKKPSTTCKKIIVVASNLCQLVCKNLFLTKNKPNANKKFPINVKSWFSKFSTPAQFIFTCAPAVVLMPPIAPVKKLYKTM
mmetsp:Transcript_116879/g.229293  ORF Transcript_116879/g.229293 Transcript_116879/m.229293 type:complete len:88 (-) Transcript_116879:49-312(-)